jgi:hypothetical protein
MTTIENEPAAWAAANERIDGANARRPPVAAAPLRTARRDHVRAVVDGAEGRAAALGERDEMSVAVVAGAGGVGPIRSSGVPAGFTRTRRVVIVPTSLS